MKLAQLLGTAMKSDDMLEILDGYDMSVTYDFDRTHENIDDQYWASSKEGGFEFRFNKDKILDVVFCHITPREGLEAIDRSLLDVPIFETFDEAEQACLTNKIPYKATLVASHFGVSGTADGFMPHDFYVRFMIAFVIGLPTLMVFVTWHVLGSSTARINLPNRDYWLAPERYTETIVFLRAGLMWFGILLLAFLCYVHWLVVVANSVQPAHFSEPRFFGGLVAFFVALLIWLKVLLGHFRARA